MQNGFEIIIDDQLGRGGECRVWCGELIRRIAGRREIYLGKFGETNAVVKVFTSKLHGGRHLRREVKGFGTLADAGICTAKVLAAGSDQMGRRVLVLEEISNARTVSSLAVEPGKGIEAVLEAEFQIVGQMHEAGIVQRDLHLGNFLWDGQRVYAIDPAEMRMRRRSISRKESLRQLGVLFASLGEEHWRDKSRLIAAYLRRRNWEGEASSFEEEVEAQVVRERAHRAVKWAWKAFRNCKKNLKFQYDGCSGVVSRDCFEGVNVGEFVESIDLKMEENVLKRGNTSFVSRVTVGGRDVVVKRYNHKGFWHSVRYTAKGSRARKCRFFGERLVNLGIATARPLGFVEKRRWGIIWQSYLITEYVSGIGLAEMVTSDSYTDGQKKKAVAKGRALIQEMSRYGIVHGDMKLSNIMMVGEKAMLIDLDSMRSFRSAILREIYGKRMVDYFEYRLGKLDGNF